MTHPTHFEQLLQAARAQPEPQRLLFVFSTAELPDDATPAQRRRFAAGSGGSLVPLMCVDKHPDELADFESLVAESRQAGPPWQLVFVTGLSGRNGLPATRRQIEEALLAMIERLKGGMLGGMLALGPAGEPLSFN